MSDDPIDQHHFSIATRDSSRPARPIVTETARELARLNARYVALVHANRDVLAGAHVLDLASNEGAKPPWTRCSRALVSAGRLTRIPSSWSRPRRAAIRRGTASLASSTDQLRAAHCGVWFNMPTVTSVGGDRSNEAAVRCIETSPFDSNDVYFGTTDMNSVRGSLTARVYELAFV